MIGWVDDKIAGMLGVSSPSVEVVVSWAIPLGLAAATLGLYHLAQVYLLAPRSENQDVSKPLANVEHSAPSVKNEENHNDIGLKQQLINALAAREALAAAAGGPPLNISVIYDEYKVSNNRNELRLRFFPDTDDYETDALLVICYIYKQVMGLDKLRCSFVHGQISYLRANAPNSRVSVIERMSVFGLERDFGKIAIRDSYVERIDLSEGGNYRLTARGENRARAVAQDMIKRA